MVANRRRSALRDRDKCACDRLANAGDRVGRLEIDVNDGRRPWIEAGCIIAFLHHEKHGQATTHRVGDLVKHLALATRSECKQAPGIIHGRRGVIRRRQPGSLNQLNEFRPPSIFV